MDNPSAPISHHWLDSTHISFGVLTAGFARKTWQLEGSYFNGREPDEDRWGIDLSPLDSRRVRSASPSCRWRYSESGFMFPARRSLGRIQINPDMNRKGAETQRGKTKATVLRIAGQRAPFSLILIISEIMFEKRPIWPMVGTMLERKFQQELLHLMEQ